MAHTMCLFPDSIDRNGHSQSGAGPANEGFVAGLLGFRGCAGITNALRHYLRKAGRAIHRSRVHLFHQHRHGIDVYGPPSTSDEKAPLS
jgi:hypothetical protein